MEKKRILIIDDEKDFVFFIKNNLEATGEFEVMTAHDGAAGIEAINLRKPDLVLLDVVMPEVTGPDVAEFLLNAPEANKIPFVFLTAIVTKEEIGGEPMKEIKGHIFIQKPVNTQTLVTTIKAVLNNTAREKTIAAILSGKHPHLSV